MKEDDMDEMMRKAAENYEVDAERAADWQAVYKAVHESEDGPPTEEKKKKRRFAFWWLLLIPLGWIANTEYNKFNEEHIKKINSSPATVSPKNNKANGNNQNISSSATSGSKTNDVKTNTNNNTIADEKNNNTTAKQTSGFSLKHFNAKTAAAYNNIKQTNSSGNLNNDNINNTVTQTSPPVNNQSQILVPSTAPANAPSNIPSVDNNSFNNSTDQLTDQTEANKNNSTPGSLITDTAKHNNNIATKKTSVQNQKTNSHYFYAGIIAGGDLSFVKYQDVEPLGYNVGLLVGYKFNKRLSVESGFYLAKKNYYTKGEYFDKSNIPYFDNKTLVNATGYCKMFDIPLNIKYDISTRKNHTWFVATGLSSYLMSKEYYNFDYIMNGWEGSASAPYYNTTQDWFSVFNLSAGYELKTGNKTNLRIEPYFKATLNGVGTGNISISSVGINAGIVRQIP
jgi:hypothetical protein